MTELRDRANDIYHNCETHGEIVDKIERMLILETQNADLLAALGACTALLNALRPYFEKMLAEGITTAVSPAAVIQRIDKLTDAARAAIARAKGE